MKNWKIEELKNWSSYEEVRIITYEYGAGKIVLKPASQGTGVIAGGPVRAVLEVAGISDILSKSLGSNTPINMVRATVMGLKQLRTAEEVAATRGIDIARLG